MEFTGKTLYKKWADRDIDPCFKNEDKDKTKQDKRQRRNNTNINHEEKAISGGSGGWASLDAIGELVNFSDTKYYGLIPVCYKFNQIQSNTPVPKELHNLQNLSQKQPEVHG